MIYSFRLELPERGAFMNAETEFSDPPPTKRKLVALALLVLTIFVCDPHAQAGMIHAYHAPDHRASAFITGWREVTTRFEAHLDRVDRENPGLHVRSFITAGY